jgi:phage portal protein BeeE
MYKEMKKIQTGNRSLINLFQCIKRLSESVNIATVKRLLLKKKTQKKQKNKNKKNPDLPTLILKTMQSETQQFFWGPQID